jgi:serine O-acetyltransferase
MGHLAIDLKKGYNQLVGAEKPAFFKKLKVWLWYSSLLCVVHYRLGSFAYRMLQKNKLVASIPLLIYMVIGIFLRFFRHVEISYRAQIGPGLFLGHASCIYIGDAKIGKNCNLTHSTTIGWGLGTHKAGGVPEIGDNVWIGPNSVITGSIKIGNDVVISAGSVVARDIPDRSLVMGNPARVIQSDYNNSSYFGFSAH